MIEHIRNSLLEAQTALNNFINNEQTLRNIEQAAQLLVNSFEHQGKAFSCGNGGSMCDAMHFAEELTGRYRNNRPGIAAVSISDPSHISCVANDFGYDFIFSRYIESHGRSGDVLIAISTSGKSPNVLNAAEAAKKLGVKVIGMTGKPGSKLEALADVCICAPGGDYADRVQELHIKVLHILIEMVERKLSPQNYA
ncbi:MULTISPECIES: D-sedoheptulose 7-phosphate isomerase [Pseudomonas]|jgi:D-sedoheptulose 7-phosphate isomerase|uniref:D-sedoheptulose 7-phosphate isomerase n=1 Tax=Pseudomonas TaxID=286 RepID=UPI0008546615|nr:MULTISPECIES: D-sedoheptulose 7-phosphate isomerase [Pseudomonas]MBQ53350.1 D-sedoheptulose 7-phosphate isomerase [Pseudomonadaceae bacterium]NRH29543.1 D-sedoheptulose 7-phosphate isomerase [Pseudomonas sp. MS19]OEO26365.1 phosphoheptose isomerase [Pseudomonas sp. J237]SFT40623.1 D-sedoheptulose 7-phosphate isomerase [Pseudomonas marincola]HCP56861.1 D-sedoheptulose 7-phosphate isomerase [Pseudomonas sp.]|tara:strand:- start:73 stop:660 length:588 start_codon:yes stop_codon:yes gene_type:complete